jgi:predicted nuclease of predicted toxin-antitoxin system
VADPVRFYLDEHIHGAVASGLRQHGIDVLTAQEAGRSGLPDPDQLAFATAEDRVLVTHDTDFLALTAGGATHAGIAWCDSTKFRNLVGPLLQMLRLLHGVMDRDAMKNRVEYL